VTPDAIPVAAATSERAVLTRTDSPLVAAVELGGTKCVCLLSRGPHDTLERVTIPTGDAGITLAAIAAVIERWRSSVGYDAIGIASFGPIELDRAAEKYGRLLVTPKPGWTGADLFGALGPQQAVPVGIATDVGAAATAEGSWGACVGLANHVYVTVGTGVGVGVIVDGHRLRGLGHPEAGHMRVVRRPGDRWPGACAYHGDCVEGLASGLAIARRVGRAASEIASDDTVWDQVAHALTGLVENLFLTVCPERIVLGGSVMMRQPQILTMMRGMLSERLGDYGFAGHIADKLEDYLVAPGLGDDAGPMGAVAVGREAYRNAPA
jgi:fructokinase